MKNIYKISAVLLVSLSIIVSSCKKEDEVVTPTVINGCTDNTMFNYDPTANTDDGTCIPVLLGCLDSTASNFNALANTDDGSCLPPFYDIAQGTWSISPDCDNVDILGQTISLNEQMPETIDVQGNGDNSLFIDMNGTQVSGDIDNEGNIVVNEQDIQIDPGLGFPIDVVVSGSGKIESENSGYMDLTYEFEIPIVGGTEEVDCHLTLTK
tara:strand:+ start:62 stop:691 length:630 start_codon:yes stop_codon:yes gene_type:complete